MSDRLTPKVRASIIARDGGKCTSCGMTQREHVSKYKCSLTIDHIDGNGRGSKTPNHEPSNLITLCLSCHGKKDRARREVWNGGWKRPDRVQAKRDPKSGKYTRQA